MNSNNTFSDERELLKEQNSRSAKLIGKDGIARLGSAHVAVFGVGGVGGFAVEALARAGVGELTVVDSDTVALSNINRQIIATHSTLGRPKVDVIRERVLDINPAIRVNTKELFFCEESRDSFDFAEYDYVVDAIDSLSAKIELICLCKECGTPIISAMGAGNKLDPTAFEVSDISRTSVCPLARAVRTSLRKRGVHHLKVVYSKEEPRVEREAGRSAPGSISFVPSVAGLILAGEVIKDISGINNADKCK